MRAWDDSTGVREAVGLARRVFGGGGLELGVWAAPGRVNVLGEHVDYNAGPCLPIALAHRTFVALRPRGDGQVSLVSALAPSDRWVGPVTDIAPKHLPEWVGYAVGVAWVLRESGSPVQGFDAAIASCVPLGAGLSSSAAIGCAVALALSDTFDLRLGDTDAGRTVLAAACVRAENEVVGAPTGGMDQSASLLATRGHALLLDNLDGSVRRLPFDPAADGLALLVIDTRVRHALVDGQYAARRATCAQAAAHLGVGSLRELADRQTGLQAALDALPGVVARRRVRHVVTEIARVQRFVRLLQAGSLRDPVRSAEAGQLLDASHESLRVDYDVSCPELDAAVAAARRAGAIGARMTGGGFGGCAIALIEAGATATAVEAVTAEFAARGWEPPRTFVAHPAPGAARVA